MKLLTGLIAILLLAPLAAGQTSQASVPQTQPSAFEIERLSELKRVEAEASTLAVVREDSLSKIVKIVVENDMLDAQTTLPQRDDEVRIELPDVKGVTRMKFFGRRGPDDTRGPFFQVINYNMTDPNIGQAYIHLAAYAGRFALSRDSESEQGTRSVQLIQDAPPNPIDPPATPELPVRLIVSNENPHLRIRLAATDFISLRAQHPDEIDQYVRPIARELHQERTMFALPRSLGWQIVGMDYTPDEVTAARILKIITRLDADDFHERQQAVEELKRFGPLAQLSLARLDTSKFTLQQKSEISALIEESSHLPAEELRPLASNRNLLVDLLYTDDPELRRLVIERLNVVTGRKIAIDELDDKTIDQLRREVIPATQP
ncbi:MAG TPA: hypothetical protein VHD56_03870 [Tepidisphaeraceae bacterium]|nr:hypothetical protein [Tepidisphaeraceae bacterium]